MTRTLQPRKGRYRQSGDRSSKKAPVYIGGTWAYSREKSAHPIKLQLPAASGPEFVEPAANTVQFYKSMRQFLELHSAHFKQLVNSPREQVAPVEMRGNLIHKVLADLALRKGKQSSPWIQSVIKLVHVGKREGPEQWDRISDKLHSFGSLEKGWNGYDSPPISSIIISIADAVTFELQTRGYEPLGVNATGDSSIVICAALGSVRVECEVISSTNLGLARFSSDGDAFFDASSLEELVELL